MIVIKNNLMYNDSVSQPEFPQESQPIRELHPREDVFDNIMDSFSILYKRTSVALKLSKAVFNPAIFIDDKVVIPVRQQFINDEKGTVNEVSDALREKFERTNEIARDIHRPFKYSDIDGSQLIPPPVDLDAYRLSKNVK